MRRFTNDLPDEFHRSPRPPTPAAGPPADGGYAADSDLSQMTDDGCPLGPDPTRWADPEWRDDPAGGPANGRDNLGELDTFDAPPAGAPTAPADSHWQRLRDQVELMERWRAACERRVRGSGRGT